MQSPPVEWALGIGYLIAVDIIRDHGDPDGDTLTECLRVGFHVNEPVGRAALAASIAAGGLMLYRHLVKHPSQPTAKGDSTPWHTAPSP